MDPAVRALVDIGDRMFSSRPVALWQALAENFHPARADFYGARMGEEEINYTMSSIPILMRRELAEALRVNLRPKHKQWLFLTTGDELLDRDYYAKAWMEYATGVMRRALYDHLSGFVKAMNSADEDWVTFGQSVIYVGLSQDRARLSINNYHLRDCAWSVGPKNIIDTMHRKWEPTIRQLVRRFPKTVHGRLKIDVTKEPERTVKCRHIVVPHDNGVYESGKSKRDGYLSLIVDTENDTILEEVGQRTFRYVVPRWLSDTTSAWARSPVCEIMLPDSRTLQSLTRIVLEAGEKAVDPATILSEEVFRSDLDLRAGGITWADLEYDQRLADKFAVLSADKSGMPVAMQMSQLLAAGLRDGFYVTKLEMPNPDRERVTAFEIRQALLKHMVEVAPVFDPYEEECLARIMDEVISLMLQERAFGPPQMIPEVLQGRDVKFRFSSPVEEIEKEVTAQQVVQGGQLIQSVMPLEPAAIKSVHVMPALKAALEGIGWKQEWLAAPEEVAMAMAEFEQKKKLAEGVGAAQQIAKAGKDGGSGLKDIMGAAQAQQLEGGGGAT